MDSTRFSKQCEILTELYMNFADDPEWETFFENNDMGVPLAVLIVNEACVATEGGKDWVQQSWNNFCEMLDVDFFADYDSLEAMLEFSDEWTWANDE